MSNKVLDESGLSHFWQGLKSKFIGDTTYNTTQKAIQKTRLTSNEPVTVVTADTLKTAMELNNVGNFKAVSTVAEQGLTSAEQTNAKTNIGLQNVGNFKAVSTEANQGLSDTEKANARTNLGIPTTTIYTYKGSVTAVADLPTHTSTPAPQPGDVWNVTSTGKNYAYVEYSTTEGDIWDDLGGEFAIESITNAEIDSILAT